LVAKIFEKKKDAELLKNLLLRTFFVDTSLLIWTDAKQRMQTERLTP